MKAFFAGLLVAASANANPVPLDIDLFSTANFTGNESAAGTIITITNGSTVNFLDQSDPDTAPISVSNDSFLFFSETSPTTYSGQLSGSGTVTKNGPGTLIMSGNNSGFTGPLFVQSGTLFLDGAYGGNVSASASATIIYNGPISGDLNITSGTITTNGVNTLLVGGNYTQSPGSVYIAIVNSLGQSSLIDIAGTAMIAGSVQVDASAGILINHMYDILHAAGGVTGTYSLINPYPALNIFLSYDANNVYLSFTSNFGAVAETPNEKKVAKQLDQLTPTTDDEAVVLSALLPLSGDEVRAALNTLSGESYSNLILTNLYDGNRFNRKIYNALRPSINPCTPFCDGIHNWLSFGGGQGFQAENEATPGFDLDSVDLAVGMHGCIGESWVFGGALGYNYDVAHSDLHARSTMNNGKAALYSLFQREWIYFAADLIGTGTWADVKRHIDFGTIHRIAHSAPHLASGRLDLQVGGNLGSSKKNIQPYLGGSAEIYYQARIHEQGAQSLNLALQSVTKWLGSSQIGFHSTADLNENVSFDFDIAWQHYFGPLRVDEEVQFIDFGTPFLIQGPKRGRDGCLMSFYLTTPVENVWSFYVGTEGEIWKNWTAYEVDAGVNYRW